jgi:uncharacterized membrane protein (UPF0127 family)
MKSKILITSIIILVVVFVLVAFSARKSPQITIAGNTWVVELADTEDKQTLGLSSRASLVEKTGLLFTFPRLDKQYFWMKDMLFPIDMIFLDDKWKIVLIESNVGPETFPTTFGGQILAKYVLEVNAGEAKKADLKVGDTAVFQIN